MCMFPSEVNFACPQCGQIGPESWQVTNEVFALMKVRKGKVNPVRFSENEGFAVKPLVCLGCGYTLLFKASVDDVTEE